MRTRTHSKPFFACSLLGTAAVALILSLAACSPEPDTDPGTAPSAGNGQALMADWQTKLNDCLAAEGVDPNRKRQPNGGSQAAYTKCYAEVGPPPQVDGPPRPSREESLKMDLAFAKCMREAGYDYPDPDPDADDTSAGQAVSPGDFDRTILTDCMSKAYGENFLNGFGGSK